MNTRFIFIVVASLIFAACANAQTECGYVKDATGQNKYVCGDDWKYPRHHSPKSNMSLHGYPCTVDCSGHDAGYDWAKGKGITDPAQCSGNSLSFIEGCRAAASDSAITAIASIANGAKSNSQTRLPAAGILSWIVLGLLAGIVALAILPGDVLAAYLDALGAGRRFDQRIVALVIMLRSFPGRAIIMTILGIAGAFVGHFISRLFGFGGFTGFNFSSFIIAVAGAIIILFGYWKLKKK